MDGSTSLNVFKNIEFVTADTPEELKDKLRAIKSVFSILGIYSYKGGNAHIAWLNMDRPFVNMKPAKKEKTLQELNKTINK